MMQAKEELLSALLELSRLAPDFRLGQLVALMTSRSMEPYRAEYIASIDDEELLPAARELLEIYRARRISANQSAAA